MEWIFDAFMFAAGYAASCYTWAYIRTAVQGTQSEITALEARAAALKVALGITPPVSNLAPVAPVPPVTKPPAT